MKKIGLVTWYDRGPNYGTCLQAFALQRIIESFGYECIIIKYKKNNKIKNILTSVYFYIFNKKMYIKRKRMLSWVKDNIKITRNTFSYEQLEKNEAFFDSYVCGSDQIWSTAEEVIDPFYYLQFTDINKRISYAPSIGKNKVGKTVQNKFVEYIQGFNCLSIRETTGSNIIEKLTNKKPLVVADPTLLLKKDEWIKLLNIKKKNNKKRVLFAYFLSENNDYFGEITKFANNNDFILHSTVENYNSFGNSIALNPKEFIEELYNADFIVTDSFHGMIFSIIFNKNFVVFKRFKDDESMNQNSRVIDFLNSIKLSSRIYNDNLELLFNSPIEYSNVLLIIDSLLKKSRNYLEHSLYESIKKSYNR